MSTDRLPAKGPNSPFSVGSRTLLARTCTRCGRFADGDSFPILNRGTKNEARRKTCHECTNVLKRQAREQRGSGLPHPNKRVPEDHVRTWREWTQEEDRYLREHLQTDSYAEIASVLGRTLRAVYKRRDVLGLPKVRKTLEVAEPWQLTTD